MKALRFFLLVLYAGYLVNVGLLLLILPWSEVWGLILTRFPLNLAMVMDAPWLRGIISAFGLLHLLLIAWEMVSPFPASGNDQATEESHQAEPS